MVNVNLDKLCFLSFVYVDSHSKLNLSVQIKEITSWVNKDCDKTFINEWRVFVLWYLTIHTQSLIFTSDWFFVRQNCYICKTHIFAELFKFITVNAYDVYSFKTFWIIDCFAFWFQNVQVNSNNIKLSPSLIVTAKWINSLKDKHTFWLVY